MRGRLPGLCSAMSGGDSATEAGRIAAAGSLRRAVDRGPLLVGHKGAAHLAPGNTLASFDAALGAGVDMIEFDVLSERPDGGGRLLVAHDYGALQATRQPLGLEDALAHLNGRAFAEIELDVDLKLPGYALRVIDALRDADLIERSLVSSTYPNDLDLIRRHAPEVRIGWSVPRARRDYTGHPFTAVPALALLAALRAWLPRRAQSVLRAGRFDAIMAHWRLVSTALVDAVASGDGELYVWTVDDAITIERIASMGVSGIITNDPRLFVPA